MGGKIIPRIRLTSAKDLVEVEAELGIKFPSRHLYLFSPPETVIKSESDECDLQFPSNVDIQSLCSAHILCLLLPHCHLWHNWEYSHDHLYSQVRGYFTKQGLFAT